MWSPRQESREGGRDRKWPGESGWRGDAGPQRAWEVTGHLAAVSFHPKGDRKPLRGCDGENARLRVLEASLLHSVDAELEGASAEEEASRDVI